MGKLQIRLKSCLQTIIDLQPAIQKGYGEEFAEDFSRLQIWLGRVESMELGEEDVQRLEELTCELLKASCFSRRVSPLLTGGLQ